MTAVVTPSRRSWRSVRASSLLALVAAGAVGFLAVAQLGSTQRFSQRLQAESEGDLTRILSNLTTTDAELRDEIGALKLQLQSLRTSSAQDVAAQRLAEQQLADLQVLAGTVSVTGPGVVVTIDDPDASVQYDMLIDVVEELRDAGAEAVAVNDHRIGASSWFGEQDGKVVVDGSSLTAPFVVEAIGQPATLDGGLAIPGGAVDTLRTQRGVHADVRRVAKLDLPALATAPSFQAARPIGSNP